MVCLSSRGPNSDKLLRYASRLAGKMNRNWYAVYVQTPSEETTVIDARTQRLLSDTLTLAKQLGALVFTYKGEDIVDTILRFAKEYRVGHIIIGRPGSKPFFKKFGKNRDIVGDLIKNAVGVTVIVSDTREEEPWMAVARKEVPETPPPGALLSEPTPPSPDQLMLSQLITSQRIIIWDRPAIKEVILQQLVEAAAKSDRIGDPETLLKEVLKREEQGSTFFNEGVAFPHARINGLTAPIVALGLTGKGVSDVLTEKPIEIVFLILSPAQIPDIQVKVLGLTSRAAQNRQLLQSLKSAQTPEEVLTAIRNWERP